MVWLSICETNIHVNLTSDFMEGYLDNVRRNTMPFFLARSNPIETYRILSNKALLQLDGL